jgi:riboflavin kinase
VIALVSAENMTDDAKLQTLFVLVRERAHEREIGISLKKLAKHLGVSKQTAARRLAILEDEGLITRRYGPRGQAVKILPAGIAELKTVFLELEKIFRKRRVSLKFSGRVTTGFGEGGYYMRQPTYAQRFKKELGYVPYPGTLDIKLDPDSRETRDLLLRLSSREIQGFKTKERTFGPVKLFLARLNDTKGAVVLPLRSPHRDILEFIAAQNLRKTLKLKDGSRVEVEVEL